MFKTRLPLVILLVIVAMTIGCRRPARPLTTVTGKVTYCGKPLTFGTVVFQPAFGQYATGVIQPDGTFAMTTRGEGDGVPVGRNKVRIVCLEKQNPNAPNSPTSQNSGGEGSLGKSLIPQKYMSCETSGIAIDVQPGENKPVLLELTDR